MNRQLMHTLVAGGLLSVSALALAAQGASQGAASAPGVTQSGDTQQGASPQGQASQQAERFIQQAAKGNLGEIKLGDMATEMASSAEVRQFGQRLAEDHRKASEQLRGIAEAKGVDWPEGVKPEQEQLSQKLAQASGDEFDQMFIQEMVKAHQKTIQNYQSAAQQLQDPQVQQYVELTVPVLEEHLDRARTIQEASAQTSAR